MNLLWKLQHSGDADIQCRWLLLLLQWLLLLLSVLLLFLFSRPATDAHLLVSAPR
jgi:hypothetical protein